ncbi:MAG: hypothetical protein M0R37_12860 [Bacteroidales bacterium]|nr:hypothetical protein [Bacteroidales bacterium]
MTGRLFIDTLDAFITYGVAVTAGGYDGLVSYPSLKEVDTNDWPEADGIEADLSEVFLDSKTFTLDMVCANGGDVGALIAALSDGAYHTFNFADLGITRSLRLVSAPKYDGYRIYHFSLSLADDSPLDGYEYVEPFSTGKSDGFEIDGKDFSLYGIRVLDGTMNEIDKTPDVKENLKVSISGMSGSNYDPESVFYKSKEVKLNLFMHMAKEDFWKNYNAFLYDLTRSGFRTLYVDARTEEHPCHYKGGDVKKLSLVGDMIWCEFTVTLVFLSYRPGEEDYVLADEDGNIICDENYNAIESRL